MLVQSSVVCAVLLNLVITTFRRGVSSTYLEPGTSIFVGRLEKKKIRVLGLLNTGCLFFEVTNPSGMRLDSLAM